ncbi:MAG: S1 RNA-binding domain-containing protein [Oligoflexia bacterium]|nr:S1 RNA-binding domain-containing protein [Oligoflexia bacterium]
MAKKKAVDLFGDEDLESKSTDFANLLEDQNLDQKKLHPGDKLKGAILTIGNQEAFISTGTPIDGALPIADLLDSDNQVKFKVGDVIEVKVVRVGDAEILLKRLGTTNSSGGATDLGEAFELELPVDGKVTELIKGGFRVEVKDKLAFCPISQMDFHVDMPEDYLGKRYLFLITKFDQNGRNLVVSRRRILDLQKQESEGDFLQRYKKGDIFQGKITRLEKFGAFIEVHGSIQGLIPISELAWARVNDPRDIVSIGQTVQVILLDAAYFEGRLKASFSLKQGGGEGDPWLRVVNDFPVGTIFEGIIERKEPYGIFVNVMPGVTGLLPKSKYADSSETHIFERAKKGDKVKVQIDEIRFEEKRISLSPPIEKFDLSGKSLSSSNSQKGFGSFGDLLKDVKIKK